MAEFLSTNLGLATLPEIEQKDYPQIYAELIRIRNALHVLQTTIEVLAGGTAGQVLTKNSGANFDIHWV